MDPDDINIDTEKAATDQNKSFSQQFEEAETVQERISVISNFIMSLGFDENTSITFVTNNIDSLCKELYTYGADEKNPFILFLLEYRKNNGNIQELLDTNNYNIVHNSVARNTFDEKQIAFTCPEEQQPKILLNKNLYTIDSITTKTAILGVWRDLGISNLDGFIINKYVRYLLTDATFSYTSNKTTGFMTQFNDFCSNIRIGGGDIYLSLRRSIIFSTALTDALTKISGLSDKSESQWLSEVNKIKENFKNALKNVHPIKATIVDSETMQKSINALHRDVQQSDRATGGQYQRNQDSDTTRNRNETNFRRDEYSYRAREEDAGEKSYNDPKVRKEISDLKNVYNGASTSNRQLKRELRSILKTLDKLGDY